MTRKRRRLIIVLAALLSLGVAVTLILTTLQDNLVFFFSPSDLLSKSIPEDRRIRLGGLVEVGSITTQGVTTVFRVTDGANTRTVTYTGSLPDLFREGQGVVAGGKIGPDRIFVADEILAKHDEKYMPPEVADALKRSGQWKPEAGK